MADTKKLGDIWKAPGEKKSSSDCESINVKNWNELKNQMLELCSMDLTSKVDLSKYWFVFDVDFTTYTYSKRGDEPDMMYDIYSNEQNYSDWGETASVDEGTAILMDKHVKNVYDFLIEAKANITFVTSRGEESKDRTKKELFALGFKGFDLMCVGKNSKAKTFLDEKKPKEGVVIVMDDEMRHLDSFKKENTQDLKFILFRYAALI